jgi:hypothetical protein
MLQELSSSNTTHTLSSIPQYVFVSFGGPTPNYHFRVYELGKQMKQIFPFFQIYTYTEQDLQKDSIFWSQHGSFLLHHKRGYGYWLWKPYLLQQTIQTLHDNDILIYMDAGCTINPQGIPRFQEYLQILHSSPFGMIAFQLSSTLQEISYTKRTLLENMKITSEDKYSGQFMATVIMIRKTSYTVTFLKEWYTLATNYENLDDTKHSTLPEYTEFRDHRHDQSIYSLLIKRYLQKQRKNSTEHAPICLPDETFFFPHWYTSGIPYPIWATRIR